MSDDFRFGDPRFPTCCAKPRGCTNKDPDEWLCAPRDAKPDAYDEYATEGEALSKADEWARGGVLAVVWPVEVEGR